MALQGTLDTFALPDVLRLLAATKKSGHLQISGSRGTGSAWVSGGDVTSVVVDHAPLAVEPVDALFELLRFEDGSFTFDADATPPDGDHLDVEPLLDSAQSLLAEWREIEAIVPSLTSWVSLCTDLPADEITIDQDRWTTLVAVGSGATVGNVGESLGLAELPVSRAVRELVELGIADVEARAPEPVQPAAPTPQPASEPKVRALPPLAHAADAQEPAEDDEPTGGDGPAPGPRARRARPKRLVASSPGEPEVFVPLDLSALQQQGSYDQRDEVEAVHDASDEELAAAFPGLAATGADPVEESVQTAEAPEGTDDHDDHADHADPSAQAADEDEPLNRGMLLKFLSSVKS